MLLPCPPHLLDSVNEPLDPVGVEHGIREAERSDSREDSVSSLDDETEGPTPQAGSCDAKPVTTWSGDGGDYINWELTSGCHFVVKSARITRNYSCDQWPWRTYRSQIVRFTIEDWTNTGGLTNLYGAFADLNPMISINGLAHINDGNVTGMWRMIYYNKLTALDLSGWDLHGLYNANWTTEGAGHGFFAANTAIRLMRVDAGQAMRGCYDRSYGGDIPVTRAWISEDRTWSAVQHSCRLNGESGDRYSLGSMPVTQWYGVPGTAASVSYDLNGGSVAGGVAAPAPVTATFPDGFRSTTVTMPAATGIKKDGYRLLGWSRSPTATDPQYKPGERVPFDDLVETLLYAVWQKAPVPTLDSVAWPYALADGGTGVHAAGSIDAVNGGPLLTDDKFVAHWKWTGTDGTSHETNPDPDAVRNGNNWSSDFTDFASIKPLIPKARAYPYPSKPRSSAAEATPVAGRMKRA